MKFMYLLKKELKELLTPTTIVILVLCVFGLTALGSVMDNQIEEGSEDTGKINICDQDKGTFSGAIIEAMKDADYEVNEVELTGDDYVKQLKDLDLTSVVIIPQGFDKQMQDIIASGAGVKLKPVDIQMVTRMESLSITGNIEDGSMMATSAIDSAVKTVVYSKMGVTPEQMVMLEAPVALKETTIVGDKQAEASATMLSAYVMMSSMFVPIVIFLLIIYSSQMIMNAVATEKIDKTLETLLSAPISRLSVLLAKMTAASVVSALYAVAFLIGFKDMMGGMTDTISGAIDSSVVSRLGLDLSMGGYIMLVAQMFLSLLITLAVSLILGALAKDAKSSQTLLLPIMGMVMIPYMISLFTDISALGPFKWVLYAIPYSHTFMAQTNIILNDMPAYFGGLIYQLILLIICMGCAVKMFTSDKIFTLTLNFGERKSKYAKARKKAAAKQ